MADPSTVHWRARLLDVQDMLLRAHRVDQVAKALMQLTAVLADEWDARQDPHDEIKLALIRDASRLLNGDRDKLSWWSDVKDWNRAASPFLPAESSESET